MQAHRQTGRQADKIESYYLHPLSCFYPPLIILLFFLPYPNAFHYFFSDNKVGVSWTGRTDSNKRVVFPASTFLSPVLTGLSSVEAQRFAGLMLDAERGAVDLGSGINLVAGLVRVIQDERERERGSVGSSEEDEMVIEKGSYVVVKIIGARGHTLR